MFRSYNANPRSKRVGDCTVRAISLVLGKDWDDAYIGMAIEGFVQCDMPSANHVWGRYLKRNGFTRALIDDDDDEPYTVRRFCDDHPYGSYLLAIDGHVVAVIDGDYYDTWDSGNELPVYYWKKDRRAEKQ